LPFFFITIVLEISFIQNVKSFVIDYFEQTILWLHIKHNDRGALKGCR